MSCARTAAPLTRRVRSFPCEASFLPAALTQLSLPASRPVCLGSPLTVSVHRSRGQHPCLCVTWFLIQIQAPFWVGTFPSGTPRRPPPPRVQPRTYAPWGQEVLPRFLQRARPREGSLLRGGDPLMVPWAPDPILQSFLRELGPNTHVACEDPSLSRQGRDCVCPRAGWCLGRPRSHTLNPDSTTEPAAPGRPCDRCHCFDSQRDFPAGPTGSQHGSSWESTAHGPAGPERAANQRLPPPPLPAESRPGTLALPTCPVRFQRCGL